MILHQALHGLGRGHQLLAASVELTTDENVALERLSDLSGHVDASEDFEHYHLGYPCGRWVVVARTWVYREAKRRGTVFTHSLLFRPEDAVALDDPGRLDGVFARPRSHEDDVSAWRRAVEIELPRVAPPAASPEVRMRVLAALFLVETRPVLWLEPETAELAGRLAWIALPPAQRAAWSWCTRALHPRYLGDLPLRWMAPGPSSRSAFSSLRAAAIGATLPAPMEQAARQLGLHELDLAALPWSAVSGELTASRVRLVLRHARLSAKEEWPSVMGCLDVDEALDVRDHPLADADVDRAIALLARRAPADRTLIELADLIMRKPWVRAPSRIGALEELVAATLAPQVARLATGDEQRLVSAVRGGREGPLGRAVDRGLAKGLAAAPADVRRRVQEALTRAGLGF